MPVDHIPSDSNYLPRDYGVFGSIVSPYILNYNLMLKRN
jgi:hypothetical protein